MNSSQKAEQLLNKLIDISSVSGNELAICDYVFNLLKTLTFDEVKKIEVDENGYDIYASKGKPVVAFQAHLDVVPPHIAASSNSTTIFGRGSCDTKASVATMIVAAQAALAAGLTDFALAFTVREETSMIGIKKLVEAVPDMPFTIVGEPSQLQAVNKHYGMMTILLETEGKAAHTSQSDQGLNAIDALISAAADLKAVSVHPESVLALVRIEGGVANNIVPPKASARYSFRMAPNDTTNYLDLFSDIVKNHPLAKVTRVFNAPSVSSEIPSALSFLGEGSTVKYFTELSFLPTGLILGPGNIAHAHSNDEQIEKQELGEAVALYLKVLTAMTTVA